MCSPSTETRLEDIADAFSHVGDVLYMQRNARNNGPTVVHFRHNINIEMACSTTMLEHVTIVPVTRAGIQNFISLAPKFKKHLRKIYKGAQKSKYLRGIEAKENRERRESIIIRTAHDPLYRNPDPSKYQFEGRYISIQITHSIRNEVNQSPHAFRSRLTLSSGAVQLPRRYHFCSVEGVFPARGGTSDDAART